VEITYDPLLTEAVVLQEIARRREAGDQALFSAYHAAADPLYHRPPDRRDAAFRELHRAFFLRLGCAGTLETELSRVPSIEARVSEILVALAASSHEEGADLSFERTGVPGQPATRAGIRLRAERFMDMAGLSRYLRHELLHVDDLLSPAFGYGGDGRLALGSPMEENLVRGRYRLFWCLSIDARLETMGEEPLVDRAAHRNAFEAEYAKFPPPVRETIFDRLWRPDPPSHRWLLNIATDSRRLLSLAGHRPQLHPEPIAGSPCPLCRFPTYDFVNTTCALDGALVAAIQREFPSWATHDGLCQRCLEVYAVMAGRW
jgi:hypothetical protein